MNHSIEVEGYKFFTAQVVDSYECKTYDMTLIFLDYGDEHPLVVVDYYYGEPNPIITEQYARNYINSSKEAPHD